MLSAKSESDITSLAPSSPSRSPKLPVYYVQSPSRDSHDGDKSSSMKTTPASSSPMEFPSHPSFRGHSRNLSASRFSGIFRSSSGRKGSRKRNDKGWPECNVILEEGSYDEFEDKAFSRRFQVLIAVFAFVVLFTVFCLIIWGASRPYKAKITLMLKKCQPRKSQRVVSVNLEGNKVPLYGAGSTITVSQTGVEVPLTLEFEVHSKGNVVGKLVRTRHHEEITCPLSSTLLKQNP